MLADRILCARLLFILWPDRRPTGAIETYLGGTKVQTRNSSMIAETLAGRMIFEAIGQVMNVRLTVRRESLREPQQD